MKSSMMNRRSFIGLAAASVAAAAVSSTGGALREIAVASESGQPEDEVKRIRTACRGCGKFECGVIVTVKNGRAIKIEGDTTYPGGMGNCCAKSQASIQAAYHPQRVKYPMKRTNPKGADDPGWVRISWEEAIDTADKKLTELAEKYGGECLAFFGGTSRIYCMSAFSAYAYLYNSPNRVGTGQVCKGPRTIVSNTISHSEFFFVENIWQPDIWIQWGSGIEVSNYDDAGRTAVDNANKARDYINVDARMSNLGKEADHFLGVRPGTDVALLLSWYKMAMEEETYDDNYVRRWTNASFIVVDDMEPSGWMKPDKFVTTFGPMDIMTNVQTVLLKESDLVEDGSPEKFVVWDEANQRFTYLDAATGQWEGEPPFKPKYVEGTQDYLKNARQDWSGADLGTSLWDSFEWEVSKGEMIESRRTGVSGAWMPESSPMPTVEGCQHKTVPALWSNGGFEITLKDGSVHTCTTVWEHLYDNVKEWTPEKAEEVTGVKAQAIVDAYKAFAAPVDYSKGESKSAINYAVTHEHNGNAIKTIQAFDVFDGIMGLFDVPGGHRGATRPASVNLDQTCRLQGQYDPLGLVKGNTPDAMMKALTNGFPSILGSDATATFDAMLTGEPYPIRGGVASGAAILTQSNILEAFEGLKGLEFFVDFNLWVDPASTVADMVLPVQHWLEIPGCLRTTQGSTGYYGAMVNCIEPLGEAAFEPYVLGLWYKHHGTPFWDRQDGGDPWDMEVYLADQYAQCTGMTWEEFRTKFEEDGWFDARVENRNGMGTFRRYETGWLRQPFVGKPGFCTPTTRHEIWSTSFERDMRERIERLTGEPYGLKYALPYYTEPKSSPFNDEYRKNNDREYYSPDEYPYILSTGRRIPVYFHSEHRQLPWCREVWPVPRLEVNPEDAAELGLEQGDWAWIETPFGKIRQCVEISPCVAPGRMNAEHSWWFPELEQAGKGFDLCGCNCLVDSHAQCENMGSPQLRGYLVKVYKATPENSPFNNPVPCGNDGTPIITSADDPRLKDWAPDYEAERGGFALPRL